MTDTPPPMANGAPFVLLDDARAAGAVAARLYVNPVETHTAHGVADVAPLLDRLAAAQRAGRHVAGFLSYDAAPALDPAMAVLGAAVAADALAPPLGWFGIFDEVRRLDDTALAAWLPPGAGAHIGVPKPLISRGAYLAALDQVLDYIRAGDIYQANLTFQVAVNLVGHPLAIYARLRGSGAAGYGGVVSTGDHWILSASPELFFSVRGDDVMARPMKGTARRLADADADAAARADLVADPKQRAENLMIVDLIRNDLSRIATPGSVRVPELFRVESFPTVHQMVSDVAATLPPGVTAIDVLRAAFPCGSITGAPKIRAMAIIAALEAHPRGLYTGSIGFIEPSGDAAFNVAIRTLVMPAPATSGLQAGPFRATLGLGSGIVADSNPAAEWEESLAKGAFLDAAAGSFDLIETMRYDPVEGVARLDGHLARMKASADLFAFAFNRHDARNQLQAVALRLRHAARIRMRLARGGALSIEAAPIPPLPHLPLNVVAMPLPVAAHDFRLRHKTSDRDFYDAARRGSGADEVVFADEQGFVTEGSFTNIFVERGGRLLTPPLEQGLLAGVLRAELIEQGRAVESHLRIADLADGFFLGNALRGLIPARLIAA
ncbi:MAG: hypothetical protein RLZZ58_1260 [Pseudomonadota bacterium]